MADAGEEPPAGGRINRMIANAVVRAYHARIGRGPRRAQAFYSDNVVVVLLDDPFTVAERSLLADGRAAAVRQLRQELELGMRDDFADAVAAATGCNIEAVLSDIHTDPDISVVVLVLDRPVPARKDEPDASSTE